MRADDLLKIAETAKAASGSLAQSRERPRPASVPSKPSSAFCPAKVPFRVYAVAPFSHRHYRVPSSPPQPSRPFQRPLPVGVLWTLLGLHLVSGLHLVEQA